MLLLVNVHVYITKGKSLKAKANYLSYDERIHQNNRLCLFQRTATAKGPARLKQQERGEPHCHAVEKTFKNAGFPQ